MSDARIRALDERHRRPRLRDADWGSVPADPGAPRNDGLSDPLPATVQGPTLTIAMTEGQYERLERRIRSAAPMASSSIWFALALCAAGIAATLWITLSMGGVASEAEGELTVALYSAIAVAVVLLLVHVATSRYYASTAEDVIDEIETHCRRVPPGDA
jgi:hypothetical protein